jgi:N-acetylglucosamine-6-phosphate deacetylase
MAGKARKRRGANAALDPDELEAQLRLGLPQPEGVELEVHGAGQDEEGAADSAGPSAVSHGPGMRSRVPKPGRVRGAKGPEPVEARHYGSELTVRIRSEAGLITEIEPIERVESEWWVAPPLLDVQTNGFGGVDYQAEGVDEEALLGSVQRYQRAGGYKMMLTLVTDDWGVMLARLQRLRQIRSGSPVLASAIVGWHIEGPFLSALPGFSGAHDAGKMLDPTPERMQALRTAAGNDRLLVTLAPERTGALAAIRSAVELGMRVSLGHTDAPVALLAEAVAAGATGFTHLGNGCPQLLDRHDNILWRVLEQPDLMVSLIPDGLHVSPPLFRLLHRLLPSDRVIYITDAMAAAGLGPGRYRLGNLEVDVGPDQAVRQPGQTNFAGSALRPADGIGRAATMLGVDWRQVWRRWSVAPADWLGVPCGLASGMPADFSLVRVSPDNQVIAVRQFIGGVELV